MFTPLVSSGPSKYIQTHTHEERGMLLIEENLDQLGKKQDNLYFPMIKAS